MAEDETVVVPGARVKLAAFVVFAALGAVVCAWASLFVWQLALNDPAALLDVRPGRRLGAAVSPIIFPCSSAYFVYLTFVAARKWANPPYLEIDASGVRLVTFKRTARWRWEEIESLDLDPNRGRIIFNGDRSHKGGRFGRFPMGLDLGVRELFHLLVERRRQWAASSSAGLSPEAENRSAALAPGRPTA